MNCNKNLPNCDFLDRISDSMPHTAKMVKRKFCEDKKQCLRNQLAKSMIEFDEVDKLQGKK